MSVLLWQARMQSTEAQLAVACDQLQDLRSKHKQLEARNALLEKVADIHKQPAAFVVTNGASLPWEVTGAAVLERFYAAIYHLLGSLPSDC